MNKFYFFVLTILGFVGVNAQESVVLDKIVAKIGNQILLKSEIDQRILYREAAKGSALSDEEKCLYINELLQQNLLVNQAEIDSVFVSDQEVERELQRKIDHILGFMNNDVVQFTEYYGKTVGEVKSIMREDLKKQMTSETMFRNVSSNIHITPKEVLDFYNKIPQDSLPFFNSEVEVGEILVFPQINPDQRRIALDHILDIKSKIESGEGTFEDLAKRFSDDPGSGRNGGDLGWVKRGSFVSEFEEAAFELNPGDLSDIVESDFGFHLIKLMERRGNNIWTKHILISPEIVDADIARAKLKLDSIRSLIVENVISWEDAVKQFSDESTQSYNNGGRMINPVSGTTFFETPDLDPDIFFALEDIEVGEVSEPVKFYDINSDKTYYRLLKLFARAKPHVANLEQDYDKIKQAAIQQRRSQHIADWVSETIKTTYVDLDEDYIPLDCSILKEWKNQQLNNKNN